ncbi:MAG: phage major capsid protein [Clostridium celatum]|nr:phage major capsid protein [Clostridium celatum]
MAKNRYKLTQQLDGVRASLKEAINKVDSLYADPKSTIEERRDAENSVKDLKDRVQKYENEIKELDDEAANALEAQNKKPGAQSENDKMINHKANVIRNIMKKSDASNDLKALGGNYIVNALSTASGGQGGASILPKTTSNEVITEPATKNKLRDHIRITSESNLEVPKLLFSCDNDDYVQDEETAKEIKATGSTVAFGRFKSKVFCDVSETMLLGSSFNLVNEVDAGLDSGIQAKEKKQLFGTTLNSTEKHMSFYEKESENYTIKAVSGASKYLAIKKAIADLHEDYRENAKVIMTYADYLDIIEALSNGNSSLFMAQPEQILGKPAIFMDAATIPVVGDLSYLQINYFPETISDTDKNVKTGMNTFVLTAWYDIQFRLRSAFRLAVTE